MESFKDAKEALEYLKRSTDNVITVEYLEYEGSDSLNFKRFIKHFKIDIDHPKPYKDTVILVELDLNGNITNVHSSDVLLEFPGYGTKYYKCTSFTRVEAKVKVHTFKSTGELVDYLIAGNEAYFEGRIDNKTIEFIVSYSNGSFVCKKNEDSYYMNLTILGLKDYKKFYKTSKKVPWYLNLNLKYSKPRICKYKKDLVFINRYIASTKKVSYYCNNSVISSYNLEDVTPLSEKELKELFDGQIK
jgi:hypothetical protein